MNEEMKEGRKKTKQKETHERVRDSLIKQINERQEESDNEKKRKID